MKDGLVFALGLALLLVLGAIVGKCLARDYRSGGVTIRTVALLWALTALHFALVVLAAVRSTWRFSLPTPLALGGGVLLAGAGAAMCLGAVHAFRSFRCLNFLEDARLVTGGIYRWSRNPQLVGWTLVLMGLGLVRGSAMVLFLALVAWVGYGLHLPTEEEHLRRVFGEGYEAYRCRTARYLGRPRTIAQVGATGGPPNKECGADQERPGHLRPAPAGRRRQAAAIVPRQIFGLAWYDPVFADLEGPERSTPGYAVATL